MAKNVAVIGASGTIGHALVKKLIEREDVQRIFTFARCTAKSTEQHSKLQRHTIDYNKESSIAAAARTASKTAPLDWVLVTTGILHTSDIMPEKSLRELSTDKFQQLFNTNTILPAMIAKHFLPCLNKNSESVFAALSARVGSISDNQLGGWYAYRASKAALNMLVKCAAIETARSNKLAAVVGLHPGTVDSPLSEPFQARVAPQKLFTPEFSAQRLITVIEQLTPTDSGKCFAWDGQEISP